MSIGETSKFSVIAPTYITDRLAATALAYPIVRVLVFGCAYERIADRSCSATTLRRRRDEWIEAGVMMTLRELALEAYDKLIGLQLSDVAVEIPGVPIDSNYP